MQEVVSGAARLSMLYHDSCRRRTSEMKACESEVVKSHFHSEVELQVELYSCGCCDGEELCPHGYGYEELKVDDYFMNNQLYF